MSNFSPVRICLPLIAVFAMHSVLFLGCKDNSMTPRDPADTSGTNDPTTLPAPDSLVAQTLFERKIRLVWHDRSDTEDGFEVAESAGNNISFSIVQITPENATSAVIEHRQPGIVYWYRVRAFKENIRSDYSNMISVSIPDYEWSRPFGGGFYDRGYCVQPTEDGGFIIIGETWSFGNDDGSAWLIKTYPSGMEQWNRTFGGSGDDKGTWIETTPDGGYVFIGTRTNTDRLDYDIWLVKTDRFGIELWSRTFGGQGDDYGHRLRPTPDGGYIIVGETWSNEDAENDVMLIKTDESGVEQWRRSYGGRASDIGRDVQVTTDGGYIIVGSAYSDTSLWYGILMIKTDAGGREEWRQVFKGSRNDHGNSVQVTDDGGYIIAGSTESAVDWMNAWLIKTDGEGHEQWSRSIGGGTNDEAAHVRTMPDGGYVITGQTNSFTEGETDVWLSKIDGAGNEQWARTFGGINREIGACVLPLENGNFIIVGSTETYGESRPDTPDVWLIQVGPPSN